MVAWPTDLNRRGWAGAELNVDHLTLRIGQDAVSALRRTTARFAGQPISSIGAEDFRAPAIDALMEQVALSVKQGAGLAFVSGLPAAAFSTDALRMIFWGLSAQLGKALSQSGHRMQTVKNRRGV
jgi:hypothetical protein